MSSENAVSDPVVEGSVSTIRPAARREARRSIFPSPGTVLSVVEAAVAFFLLYGMQRYYVPLAMSFAVQLGQASSLFTVSPHVCHLIASAIIGLALIGMWFRLVYVLTAIPLPPAVCVPLAAGFAAAWFVLAFLFPAQLMTVREFLAGFYFALLGICFAAVCSFLARLIAASFDATTVVAVTFVVGVLGYALDTAFLSSFILSRHPAVHAVGVPALLSLGRVDQLIKPTAALFAAIAMAYAHRRWADAFVTGWALWIPLAIVLVLRVGWNWSLPLIAPMLLGFVVALVGQRKEEESAPLGWNPEEWYRSRMLKARAESGSS